MRGLAVCLIDEKVGKSVGNERAVSCEFKVLRQPRYLPNREGSETKSGTETATAKTVARGKGRERAASHGDYSPFPECDPMVNQQ